MNIIFQKGLRDTLKTMRMRDLRGGARRLTRYHLPPHATRPMSTRRKRTTILVKATRRKRRTTKRRTTKRRTTKRRKKKRRT